VPGIFRVSGRRVLDTKKRVCGTTAFSPFDMVRGEVKTANQQNQPKVP